MLLQGQRYVLAWMRFHHGMRAKPRSFFIIDTVYSTMVENVHFLEMLRGKGASFHATAA